MTDLELIAKRGLKPTLITVECPTCRRDVVVENGKLKVHERPIITNAVKWQTCTGLDG